MTTPVHHHPCTTPRDRRSMTSNNQRCTCEVTHADHVTQAGNLKVQMFHGSILMDWNSAQLTHSWQGKFCICSLKYGSLGVHVNLRRVRVSDPLQRLIGTVLFFNQSQSDRDLPAFTITQKHALWSVPQLGQQVMRGLEAPRYHRDITRPLWTARDLRLCSAATGITSRTQSDCWNKDSAVPFIPFKPACAWENSSLAPVI